MIFASDLDKTLIYSRNSMEDSIPEEELIPVEENAGAFTSFMTKNASNQLKKLAESVLFVPVTTRTIAQYKRVFFVANELRVKYAITSNGGNILVDGTPDKEWAEQVQQTLRSSADHLEVLARYEQISSPEWALRGWLCDGLFYTMIIDVDKTPFDVLEQFRHELDALGWILSIQGRKVYLVPEKVTKGEAIRYLKDRAQAPFVAASGDSFLDASLLSVADYSIAPAHGELYGRFSASPAFSFTQRSGIRASEEILEQVQRAFQRQAVVESIS